jgi:outer membrane lipoprotein carrier protein
MRPTSVSLRSLLALTVALGLAGDRPAVAGEIEDFLGRLAAKGKQTRTLQARFVQRKRLRLFKSEVVTKGKVCFEKPDRLRWETLPPDGSVLVVNGNRAELRLPDERPRVIDLRRDRTMATLVEQLMVWLGARPAKSLSKWYRAELRREGPGYKLRLAPTQPAVRKRVRGVEVVFGADLVLRTITIQHEDRDTSHITFSEIRRDQRLPPNTFQ